MSKWKSFKIATGVTGERVVHHLLGCLENDLASLVYNEQAAPETFSENELLEIIKKVAVKPENQWVTREKLHQMKQDSGEPVVSYAARLRGQARLCGFVASQVCSNPHCGQEVSFDFTDTVVMGDLVRGLHDPEIKSIVLGEVQQETELQGLIKLIQAKEYGRMSTIQQSSINAVSNSEGPCPNCARRHKKGQTWKEHCPAKNKPCNECKKMGHFKAACRSKNKTVNEKKDHNEVKTEVDDSEESSAIEGLFACENRYERKRAKKACQRQRKQECLAAVKTMPQMIWQDYNWKPTQHESAPMVNIKYTLCCDGYVHAGLRVPIQKVRPKLRGPLIATAQAMADTGCTSRDRFCH